MQFLIKLWKNNYSILEVFFSFYAQLLLILCLQNLFSSILIVDLTMMRYIKHIIEINMENNQNFREIRQEEDLH